MTPTSRQPVCIPDDPAAGAVTPWGDRFREVVPANLTTGAFSTFLVDASPGDGRGDLEREVRRQHGHTDRRTDLERQAEIGSHRSEDVAPAMQVQEHLPARRRAGCGRPTRSPVRRARGGSCSDGCAT